MKTLALTLFLSLYGSLCVLAQGSIQIKNGCDAQNRQRDLESTPSHFDPSDEAERLVDEVVEAAGAPQNFKLRFVAFGNLLDATDQGQRYLLYSNDFLKRFDQRSTYWGAYFLLAHEIGHHLKKHDFDEEDPYRIKYLELEADLFAGAALRMLGASLKEAQAGVQSLSFLGKADLRPSAQSRLDAMTAGWQRQDKKLGMDDYEHPAKTVYLSLQDDPQLPKALSPVSLETIPKSATSKPSTYAENPNEYSAKPYEYSAKPTNYTRMPNFPLPSGQCYQRKTLVKDLSTKAATLEDIDTRLQRALDAQGYYQRSYFQTAGGFALVTKMEQFEEDGSVKQRYRWKNYPSSEDIDGVWAYLKTLVMPTPGHFRIFAFVVTNQPYFQTSMASRSLAKPDMMKDGFSGMPSEYATNAITKSHFLDVMVYEFKAPPSTKICEENCEPSLDVQEHLSSSGLIRLLGF